MAASSVTGRGNGASKKPTAKELSSGPILLITGIVHAEEMPVSPGSIGGGEVVFNTPLPGKANGYIVTITSLNGGYSYVTALNENSNGDFTGFEFITESECEVMYMVASIGRKIL